MTDTGYSHHKLMTDLETYKPITGLETAPYLSLRERGMNSCMAC